MEPSPRPSRPWLPIFLRVMSSIQIDQRASNQRFTQPLVHHTDAEREWAYDCESHIGQLAAALDEGAKKGWTAVDMKRDWVSAFAAKA